MNTPTVLEYTRDVRAQFEREGPDGLIAHVRGIVTERKNAGRAQFIEVVDVTGSIQVVFLARSLY